MRKQGTHPSHLLAEYAGSYENPGYGTITLFARNDSLFAHTSSLDMWLEHYHYDVFRPKILKEGFDDEGDSPFRLQFHNDLSGDVKSFTFAGVESGVDDIIFTKKVTAVAVEKSDLEKYVGEYELSGVTAKVYLRSETLMVLVPGQPDYETIPLGNNEFKLKVPNLDGFSVRFEMSGDKAAAMYFIQPNGTFKATRK